MSLQLVSVGYRYGRRTALSDVSLHLARGDCYGFIGHNGAGKTTAIRVALGLLPLQAGRVIVDGFDATLHRREARARLGGLVEVPGFHGSLSGRANLVLLAGLHGLDRAAARREADRVLGLVDLRGEAQRHVRAYSQGMRQRLGIAQALLGSPSYVLLDEPTSGLDPEGIADVRALVRRLTREEGVTVLLSSHQLHELAGLCNKIGVLREGRLLLEEETERLVGAASGRFALTIDRPEEALRVLAGLGLEATPEDPEGDRERLRVELGDVAPGTVSRALVEAGLELSAFAPRAPTLEEIYLRCASADAAVADRRAAAPAPRTSAPSERRAPGRPTSRVAAYELRRLLARPAVPLVLALPGLVGLLDLWQRWRQAESEREAVEGATLFSTTAVTAFEGVGVALQASVPLAALCVAGVASQSLAGELQRGTLRNLLLRPVLRTQAVLGKALGQLALVVLCYGLAVATALAGAALLFDFGDVEEILPNGRVYEMVPAEELWPELWVVLLAPLAPLAACAAVGLLAGALVR
ncbi:MAG: ATP-binding cassette domain-containing protein, partial [Planctomycetota bacterium]|nr:ATP-binding cassette domain-containing protein [Planctomycetota bacterium]